MEQNWTELNKTEQKRGERVRWDKFILIPETSYTLRALILHTALHWTSTLPSSLPLLYPYLRLYLYSACISYCISPSILPLPLFYLYLSGALLGVLQMGVWLVWDPWWSLALGGAAVGFLTDWFALKVRVSVCVCVCVILSVILCVCDCVCVILCVCYCIIYPSNSTVDNFFLFQTFLTNILH